MMMCGVVQLSTPDFAAASKNMRGVEIRDQNEQLFLIGFAGTGWVKLPCSVP